MTEGERTLSKGQNIAVWVVSVLLALAFLMAGVPKLLGQQMQFDNFEGWGYPSWLVFVVGAVEAVAAFLLLYPRTAAYGAGALVVDMVGASATHIRWSEWSMLPITLVLLALAFYVGWMRQPAWFHDMRTRSREAKTATP